MRRFVLTVVMSFAASLAAADGPVAGADAPDFVQARDAWLDGDDLLALRALKTLAEGGNTAAQILLARIAEEPHMHRHVTGQMARADRIDLLRQPGGLSGTSWMNKAAVSSELASAMILAKARFTSVTREDGSVYSPEADAAVTVLLEHGERDLATEVVFKLFDGAYLRPTLDLIERHDGLGSVVEPIRLSVEQSLAAIEAGADSDMFAFFAEQRQAIPPEDVLAGTHVRLADLTQDAEYQAFVMQNAEKVPSWTPLRDMCEVSCAPSYSTCLLAGVASMSAGRKLPFASPAQSLIPTQDYWSSARIRGDAARRMFEVSQLFEIGARFDQCFADTVRALAQ